MWQKFRTKNIVKALVGVSGFAFYNYSTARSFKLDEQFGKLYAWGWNNFGQLGLGNSSTAYMPFEVSALDSKNVKCISCKQSVSAAVDIHGRIYTWGRSKFGLLGHGHSQQDNNVNIPTLIESLKEMKFKAVYCGNFSMAAINEAGELYTWGNPDHGKLGHSYEEQNKAVSKNHYNTHNNMDKGIQPHKVNLPEKIKQVGMGAHHMVALSESGNVYVWGLNKKGSLGIDLKETELLVPTKIEFKQKISKIDCGTDYSLALTEDGKLFAWGSNYFGQLGSPSPLHYDTPRQIQGLNAIQDFSCGEQFVGAIDTTGKLLTDGQLAQPGRQDIPVPQQVDFQLKVKKISCGIGHVGIITENDQLFMFGRGKEGQLGRGTEIESSSSNRVTPQLVELFRNKKVLSIACGGSHTLAIIK